MLEGPMKETGTLCGLEGDERVALEVANHNPLYTF